MRKLIFRILCMLFVCIQITETLAADIWTFIDETGSYREIIIEGQIEAGDFEKFVQVARENNGRANSIHIFSPGGDFYEAMKIGRAVRALELNSEVPMRKPSGEPSCKADKFTSFGIEPKDKDNCVCASACFFIHIAGAHRTGTFLAVHRPYFTKGEFGELSQAKAQKAFDALQNSARTYMQEMGVPDHIQEDVLGTSSDRAMILDEKIVKTYFWGNLPYRHEWIMNKCSKLTASEAERYANYSQRLTAPRDSSVAGLSKDERSDNDYLQKKLMEQFNCSIAVTKQGRIEAYAQYFKIKPAQAK